MANVGQPTDNKAVKPIPRSALDKPGPDVWAPDVGPGSVYNIPPTLRMEETEYVPDNFDELPIEEQRHIVSRLRFHGIRLKPIRGLKVPLTRETLEL